jgi:hypothetical protein
VVGSFVYLNNNIKYKNNIIEEKEIGVITFIDNNSVKVDFIGKNIEIDILVDKVKYFNPENTGDLFNLKVCNVCHKLLDTNEFQKNQNGKNNRTVRRPSCKKCRETIDGEKVKSSERKKFLLIKPHLSKFKCPVCTKTTIAGLTSKVVLDHDHVTGEIRGWICDSCNTGLGRFKDNPILLERAILYLNKKKPT